jgi:hypothetical protein
MTSIVIGHLLIILTGDVDKLAQAVDPVNHIVRPLKYPAHVVLDHSANVSVICTTSSLLVAILPKVRTGGVISH